jgi:hypothetical protein
MKKSILLLVLVFLIPSLACNLTAPATVSPSNSDPAAQTAAVQTQVALLVASTMSVQSAVENTLAALPTDTPEFTFTPSLTPTPSLTFTPTLTPTLTFTLTSSIPMVSVSVATNCRTGPGEPYDLVGVLAVGKPAEAIGRSADGGFWIIRLPDHPAITCWLWTQYASVSGNGQALPVIPPPPSPTPSANFDVSYVNMVHCSGEFAFTFKIVNSGAKTWESIKIVVKDTVTSTSETHTRDSFKRFTGCSPSSEDQNLEPGESGYSTATVPGQFSYDPTGHGMKATITVCTKNALAGDCLSKPVNFTP